MKNKEKPIHLGVSCYSTVYASCDGYTGYPIEDKLNIYKLQNIKRLCTFDIKKVTCKRCLKHPNYKKLEEMEKYPLFFLDNN